MFAPRMKAVFLRAFAIHKRRDTLAASTLYQYRCDLQRRVTRCLALQPTNSLADGCRNAMRRSRSSFSSFWTMRYSSYE